MKKLLVSATLAISMIIPAMGNAMILDEATVAQILGPKMPPSHVVVGKANVLYFNSVQYFDNLINVTNRVLNRSIRFDVVRVHPESIDGVIRNAQRNQQAVETHCRARLNAENIKNSGTECGNGFVNR